MGIKTEYANNAFESNFIELAKYAPESEKLGAYERRVHDVICHLYRQTPEEIIEVQTIYKFIGGAGNCPETERKKIFRALDKLTFRVRIDNIDFTSEEDEEKNNCWQPSIALRIYRRLLDYELVETMENGKVISSGIRLIQEPLMLILAKASSRFRTISLDFPNANQKD